MAHWRIALPANHVSDPQSSGENDWFFWSVVSKRKVGDQDQPKYLNSPETILFNKREVLFNFDKARRAMRKDGQVYLFEGFMDVIAAWQAGIENGIASMGTSLTNQQIAHIERVAQEVILCYDGDSAGVEATNRGIDLLQNNSRLKLSVVRVPERMDPDDYLRKYGTEAFIN